MVEDIRAVKRRSVVQANGKTDTEVMPLVQEREKPLLSTGRQKDFCIAHSRNR